MIEFCFGSEGIEQIAKVEVVSSNLMSPRGCRNEIGRLGDSLAGRVHSCRARSTTLDHRDSTRLKSVTTRGHRDLSVENGVSSAVSGMRSRETSIPQRQASHQRRPAPIRVTGSPTDKVQTAMASQEGQRKGPGLDFAKSSRSSQR